MPISETIEIIAALSVVGLSVMAIVMSGFGLHQIPARARAKNMAQFVKKAPYQNLKQLKRRGD